MTYLAYDDPRLVYGRRDTANGPIAGAASTDPKQDAQTHLGEVRERILGPAERIRQLAGRIEYLADRLYGCAPAETNEASPDSNAPSPTLAALLSDTTDLSFAVNRAEAAFARLQDLA